MQNKTNLGMSLGQMLSSVFDGKAELLGQQEGMKASQIQSSADFNQAKTANELLDGRIKQKQLNLDPRKMAIYDMGGDPDADPNSDGLAKILADPNFNKKFGQYMYGIGMGEKNPNSIQQAIGTQRDNSFIDGAGDDPMSYAVRKASVGGKAPDVFQATQQQGVADGTITGDGLKRTQDAFNLGKVNDNYKERKISLDGKTYTTQQSNDGGRNWSTINGTVPVDIRTEKGGVNVSNNYTPGVDLGKPAQNKIDENLIGDTERLVRLNNISTTFKPEYMQYGTRAKMAIAAVKSKAGQKLDPKEEGSLKEFSQWKMGSLDNLSRTIKELTGSAMGVEEANRIIATLPNPGSGLFDGDDAPSFKAKLDQAKKQVTNAIARSAYIKRNGGNMSIADIPLDRMPDLINQRASSIEQEEVTRNPALAKDRKALQRNTRNRLAQEFGLVGN